jgi:hypothetical protein
MKPGEEGGWLPWINLFRWRRTKTQLVKMRAERKSRPSGMPMPMLSFSRPVRPEEEGSGATGEEGVLLGGADEGGEVETGTVDAEEEEKDEEELGMREVDNVEDCPDGKAELRLLLDSDGDAIDVDLILSLWCRTHLRPPCLRRVSRPRRRQ